MAGIHRSLNNVVTAFADYAQWLKSKTYRARIDGAAVAAVMREDPSIQALMQEDKQVALRKLTSLDGLFTAMDHWIRPYFNNEFGVDSQNMQDSPEELRQPFNDAIKLFDGKEIVSFDFAVQLESDLKHRVLEANGEVKRIMLDIANAGSTFVKGLIEELRPSVLGGASQQNNSGIAIDMVKPDGVVISLRKPLVDRPDPLKNYAGLGQGIAINIPAQQRG